MQIVEYERFVVSKFDFVQSNSRTTNREDSTRCIHNSTLLWRKPWVKVPAVLFRGRTRVDLMELRFEGVMASSELKNISR
jgi:hypothetical protein